MANIETYINRQSRNNLLFTSQEAKGIHYVDIGRLLSAAIENSLSNKRLGMKAEDALSKILSSSFDSNEEIGQYLAIKNIGILFEPALKLNLKLILSTWSRDHVLIVKHEGEIKNDIFYLAPESARYSVNLKDITYKSI